MEGEPFNVVLSTVEGKDVAIFNRMSMAILHHEGANQITYLTNDRSDGSFSVCYIAAEQSYQVIQHNVMNKMKTFKIVPTSDEP